MEFGENALLSHTMAAQIMMEEDSGENGDCGGVEVKSTMEN